MKNYIVDLSSILPLMSILEAKDKEVRIDSGIYYIDFKSYVLLNRSTDILDEKKATDKEKLIKELINDEHLSESSIYLVYEFQRELATLSLEVSLKNKKEIIFRPLYYISENFVDYPVSDFDIKRYIINDRKDFILYPDSMSVEFNKKYEGVFKEAYILDETGKLMLKKLKTEFKGLPRRFQWERIKEKLFQ